MSALVFPDEELTSRSRSDSGALRLRWEPLAERRSHSLARAYWYPASLHVDLSAYDIVSADGLVWLLALVYHRCKQGVGATYFTLPTHSRALKSLVDTRFLQHLIPLGVHLTNEFVLYSVFSDLDIARRGSRFSLNMIQNVSHSTVHPIINSLRKELSPTLNTLLRRPLSDEATYEALPLFIETLSELLINVARHVKTSDVEEPLGYACYRPWPRTYPLLRFACSDLGEGFRGSLERKQVSTASEGEALLTGLLYRFFKPEDQVIGLYQALHFLAQLRGRLYIRSRNASLSIKLENEPTRRLFYEGYTKPSLQWIRRLAHVWRCESDIPGTHIVVDLRLGDRNGAY